MKNKIFVLIGIIISLSLKGQMKINSPYSAYGLGDIRISESAHLRGMAHVGVSGSNAFFPSSVNPASYQRGLDLETKFTSSDYGFNSNWTTLSAGGAKQTSGNISLNNVNTIFPLGNKAAVGVGLRPFSTISYDMSATESVGSESFDYNRSGRGNINKAYAGGAYRFINNRKKETYFSLGLEGGYLFGTVEEINGTKLSGATTTTQFREFTSFSGTTFRSGLTYRKGIKAKIVKYRGTHHAQVDRFYDENDTLSLETYPCEKLVINTSGNNCTPLSESKKAKYNNHFLYLAKMEIDGRDTIRTYFLVQKDLLGENKRQLVVRDSLLLKKKLFSSDSLAKQTGVFFNLGFVFEQNNKINTRSMFVSERLHQDGSALSADTLNEGRSAMVLPRIFRFGISIDKPTPSGMDKYGRPKKSTWSLGVDMALNQWEQFRHFSRELTLENSIRSAIGGEYSPNADGEKWLGRWIYRAGVSYEKLPYQVDGATVDEFGVTFGSSIPLGTFSSRNRQYPKFMNIALEHGKRGVIAGSVVKENYWIMTISLTTNSRWFEKRKIGL